VAKAPFFVGRKTKTDKDAQASRRCVICSSHASFYCSNPACFDHGRGKYAALCGPSSGRGDACYNEHRDWHAARALADELGVYPDGSPLRKKRRKTA